MQSTEWLVITFVVGAILGASTFAMWREFRTNASTFERIFEPRLRRGEIHTGALFVGVSEAARSGVISEALRVARAGALPEQLLRVWQGAGARVVTHLEGPGAHSNEDAREWLRSKAEELEREPFPQARAGEALFALLYAGNGVGTTRIHNFEQAQVLCVRRSCVGLAFVACRTKPLAIDGKYESKRVLAVLAFAVSFLATLGLAAAMWLSGALRESPKKRLSQSNEVIATTADPGKMRNSMAVESASVAETAASSLSAMDLIDAANVDELAGDAEKQIEEEPDASDIDARIGDADPDAADTADAVASPFLVGPIDASAPVTNPGGVKDAGAKDAGAKDAGAQIRQVRPKESNPGVHERAKN